MQIKKDKKKISLKFVDYKDIKTLKKYTNQHGRILARKYTGLDRKSQKNFSQAVKRARFLSLIPYVSE